MVGDRADRTAKSANSSDKIHVVQKGETLSSIAAKEMGSSGKFQELFEANRDHLNDANDVRVGMSLRIPSRGTAKTQSTSSKTRDRVGNSAPPLLPADPRRAETGEFPAITVNPDKQPGNPDKQSGRPADSSPPKKKFEPVKRPPLGIKGMGTQSSEAEPASKPIRKLTQLPPGDNGGKIAR